MRAAFAFWKKLVKVKIKNPIIVRIKNLSRGITFSEEWLNNKFLIGENNSLPRVKITNITKIKTNKYFPKRIKLDKRLFIYYINLNKKTNNIY